MRKEGIAWGQRVGIKFMIYDSCGGRYRTTRESFVGSHGEDDHE